MDTNKPNAKIDSDAASSTDSTELKADEMAEKEGRSTPTDADRKKAHEEQKATAIPSAGAEEGSH